MCEGYLSNIGGPPYCMQTSRESFVDTGCGIGFGVSSVRMVLGVTEYIHHVLIMAC